MIALSYFTPSSSLQPSLPVAGAEAVTVFPISAHYLTKLEFSLYLIT